MPVGYKVVEDTIYKRKLNFSGPIDMGGYYETLWEKFRSLDFTVYEKRHIKINRGSVQDMFISWVCERKITPYVLFRIYVEFEFYNIKPVEIIEDGKKVEKKKALWRTRFKPCIVLDWKGEWQESYDAKNDKYFSNMRSRLRDWYNHYIFGRKNIVDASGNSLAVTHAFGEYKQKILKLDDLALLIINHARLFFDMAPVSGIVEV